ncbi:MAG TPA: hypothetical protein QGF58_00210 [Myxococcota bacterium]|nr:hypothetical protein [Myxococcota bacterium]
MLLALIAPLQAADVTTVPPFLRGDITVAYGADIQTGSLQEPVDGSDIQVARALHEAHVIDFGATFSVAPGAAVYFGVPTWVIDRWSWSEANAVVFDPNRQLGSMAYGEPIGETVTRTGSGSGGVWLGAKGTPFSESFTRRGNASTWLLDVGFRTPDKSNIYTLDGDSRGAGNGAPALRIRNAFSTTAGQSQPWLEFTWLRQGVTTADGLEVVNPQVLGVRSGVEVQTYENAVTNAFFAIDFRLGFDYSSWGDVPSGTYLPTVMESTQGQLVTVGEYSTVSAGLGLYWRMFQYGRIDLYGDAHYVMPHRLEHPYPVYTGTDTIRVTAGAELTVLVRTPGE